MESWDVIVVGARCAGSTLAARLAERGVRTLLLDASARGSDMAMSTHFLQPPGMDALARSGVAGKVRSAAPAIRRLRIGLEGSELLITPDAGREGHCVRRGTLDPWLQQAAEAAGAEFRDRHRVVSLVEESGRVVGVVARTPEGLQTLRAPLVVGADGPTSTIAKLTQVEEYLTEQIERPGYWGYYPAPERWEFPWDGTIEHRGEEQRFAVRCDGGLVMLATVSTHDSLRALSGGAAEKLHAMLLGSPATRPFVEGKQAVGQVYGMLKGRFFYRRPVGPGFALVGDAGHVSNFSTAQGMSDAMLDAERLAEAILDGRDAAYECYWRERDVATLPFHYDAGRQGSVGYNEPFMRWTFERIARDPQLVARLPLVAERKLEPGALVPQAKLLAWVLLSLLKGRFEVWRGFLRAARTMAQEQRELAERVRLRDEAVSRLLASVSSGVRAEKQTARSAASALTERA